MTASSGNSQSGMTTAAVAGASDTLRASDLLSGCSEAEVAEAVARSSEIALAPGELLFGEADVADAVWILKSGELLISKVVDGDEAIIDHIKPGAFLGEVSLLSNSPAEHRARAEGAVRLLRIPGAAFYDLMRSCRTVSEKVLRTMAERVRRIEHLLQERERMAELGTLAAGLAHELNNPAAAAKRAATLLREQFEEIGPLSRRLAKRQWTAGELELLKQLEAATDRVDHESRELDALSRGDREDAVGRWLEDHGVARAWEFAPVLVDRGVTAQMLEQFMRGCDPSVVSDALAWSERVATIRQLLEELEGSTTRMAQMVKAVKAYSYADTTTLRSADVHEGLETSLTILGHKLRDAGVTVERMYDRNPPPIQMYGTELGQVWTNLLDNATDAIAGAAAAGGSQARGGRITIATTPGKGAEEGRVRVEITDTGPGISPDALPRIFEPFFTTKEVGKGTGLGLEIVKRIVKRHRGTIDVNSEPGATRFVVSLPISQSEKGVVEGGPPAPKTA